MAKYDEYQTIWQGNQILVVNYTEPYSPTWGDIFLAAINGAMTSREANTSAKLYLNGVIQDTSYARICDGRSPILRGRVQSLRGVHVVEVVAKTGVIAGWIKVLVDRTEIRRWNWNLFSR